MNKSIWDYIHPMVSLNISGLYCDWIKSQQHAMVRSEVLTISVMSLDNNRLCIANNS